MKRKLKEMVLVTLCAVGLTAFAGMTGPQLVPDYNRDGKIDETDYDRLATGEAFTVWLNDDDDAEGTEADEGKGDTNTDLHDVPGGNDEKDCEDDRVNGRCDLLDFFPVLVDVTGVPEWENYTWKLSSKSVNVVFTGLRADTAGDFHTKDEKGVDGDTPLYKAAVENLEEGVELPEDGFLKEGKGVILIEGAALAEGGLTLRGTKEDSDPVEVTLNLRVVNVEDMYGWLNLRPEAAVSSKPPYQSPAVSSKPPYQPPSTSQPDSRHFILVHGYNTNHEEARGNAAEFYKKLWQSGSDAMFTAVEWRGDQSQIKFEELGVNFTPNYYVNVENAFVAARPFAEACKKLPGEKILVGHSLGNILISSAIKDYGLDYTKFVMLNAAVAREAFDASAYDEDMVSVGWKSGEGGGSGEVLTNHLDWASRWYRNFAGHEYDSYEYRRKLAWRGRFANLPRTVNYYSPTDNVLLNPDPHEKDLDDYREEDVRKEYLDRLVGTKNQKTGFGFWSFSEKMKGTRVIDVINVVLTNTLGMAQADAMKCEAGWGENPNYVEDIPFSPTNTHFTPFLDERLKTIGMLDIFPAETERLMAQHLADAIPAESFAAGANEVATLENVNMEGFIGANSEWPVYEGEEVHTNEWKHSAFREVAFYHTSKFYASIAAVGKPRVIIDTDLGSSMDDLFTIDLAARMQHAGKLDLMAVMMNRPDGSDPTGKGEFLTFADRYLASLGLGDLPIGKAMSPVGMDAPQYVFNPYWTLIYSNNVTGVGLLLPTNRTDAQIASLTNAVALYRRLLKDAPDKSVVICSLGFLNNLKALMDSGTDYDGDGIESTGLELIAAKVKELRIMAGCFDYSTALDGTDGAEYNAAGDPLAAKKVFEEWPTPVVASPWEVGLKLEYKPNDVLADFPTGTFDPVVRAAYVYWPDPGPDAMNRLWDVMTVLPLTEGETFAPLSEMGGISVDDKGKTIFTPDPSSNRCYQVASNMNANAVMNRFRAICRTGNPSVSVLPISQAEPGVDYNGSVLTVKIDGVNPGSYEEGDLFLTLTVAGETYDDPVLTGYDELSGIWTYEFTVPTNVVTAGNAYEGEVKVGFKNAALGENVVYTRKREFFVQGAVETVAEDWFCAMDFATPTNYVPKTEMPEKVTARMVTTVDFDGQPFEEYFLSAAGETQAAVRIVEDGAGGYKFQFYCFVADEEENLHKGWWDCNVSNIVPVAGNDYEITTELMYPVDAQRQLHTVAFFVKEAGDNRPAVRVFLGNMIDDEGGIGKARRLGAVAFTERGEVYSLDGYTLTNQINANLAQVGDAEYATVAAAVAAADGQPVRLLHAANWKPTEDDIGKPISFLNKSWLNLDLSGLPEGMKARWSNVDGNDGTLTLGPAVKVAAMSDEMWLDLTVGDRVAEDEELLVVDPAWGEANDAWVKLHNGWQRTYNCASNDLWDTTVLEPGRYNLVFHAGEGITTVIYGANFWKTGEDWVVLDGSNITESLTFEQDKTYLMLGTNTVVDGVTLTVADGAKFEYGAGAGFVGGEVDLPNRYEQKTVGGDLYQIVEKIKGCAANPWDVGDGVTAWTNGTELVIQGAGTITNLAEVAKDGLTAITITEATVMGATDGAFAGINVFTLTLPDGWQGELPDEAGNWYGATGVTLTAYPLAVKNVKFQQRYPWNGLVDVGFILTGPVGETNVVITVRDGETAITNFTAAVTIPADGALATNLVWDATTAGLAANFNSDDVTIEVAFAGGSAELAGVQLWENGPYWAEANLGESEVAEHPEYGALYKFDDAGAAVKTLLGEEWRVPTKEELENLAYSCTKTWDATKGYTFTGTTDGYTDKSIFLPAAGYDYGDGREAAGGDGSYWSSELDELDDNGPYSLYFYEGFSTVGSGMSRSCPMSIRAVRDAVPAASTISAKSEAGWLDLTVGDRVAKDVETLVVDPAWGTAETATVELQNGWQRTYTCASNDTWDTTSLEPGRYNLAFHAGEGTSTVAYGAIFWKLGEGWEILDSSNITGGATFEAGKTYLVLGTNTVNGTLTVTDGAKFEYGSGAGFVGGEVDLPNRYEQKTVGGDLYQIVEKIKGCEDNPWVVGDGVTAYTNGTELVIGGEGTITNLAEVAKDGLTAITITEATVMGATDGAFAGINGFTLTLPDGWQGELPDEDGNWYGATGVTLTAYPLAVKNVTFQQRYPWNGKVDIACDVTGADTVELNVMAFTNGVLLGAAKTIIGETTIDFGVTGGVTNGVRLVWNAAADLPENFIANDIQIKVAVQKVSSSFVQLWADGPYFATCNIGASKPEDYGSYMQFDETARAVTDALGASWRVPTAEDFEGLTNENYCTTLWTNNYNETGISGRIVTSTADPTKSIFLPAAGAYGGSGAISVGSEGYYWSSTPNATNSSLATAIKFRSEAFYVTTTQDCLLKMSVRAVWDAPSAISEAGALDLREEVMLDVGEVTVSNVTWSATAWGAASEAAVTLGWTNETTGAVGELATGLTGEGVTNTVLPKKDGDYRLTHSTDGLKSFVKFTVSGYPLGSERNPWEIGAGDDAASMKAWKDGNTVFFDPARGVATKAGLATVTNAMGGANFEAKLVSADGSATTNLVMVLGASGTAYKSLAEALAANEASYTLFETDGYFVSYSGGEGALGTMATDTFIPTIPTNLTANAYTIVGYAFTGWSKDGTTVAYTNRQEGVDFAKPGETLVLTALWTHVGVEPTGYNDLVAKLPQVTRPVTFDLVRDIEIPVGGKIVVPAGKSVTFAGIGDFDVSDIVPKFGEPVVVGEGLAEGNLDRFDADGVSKLVFEEGKVVLHARGESADFPWVLDGAKGVTAWVDLALTNLAAVVIDNGMPMATNAIDLVALTNNLATYGYEPALKPLNALLAVEDGGETAYVMPVEWIGEQGNAYKTLADALEASETVVIPNFITEEIPEEIAETGKGADGKTYTAVVENKPEAGVEEPVKAVYAEGLLDLATTLNSNVTLTVVAKDAADVADVAGSLSNALVAVSAGRAGFESVSFVDLSVTFDGERQDNCELGQAITLHIPWPVVAGGDYGVVRMHNGVVQAIPQGEVNAVDGEFFTVDLAAREIVLHVDKFSDYAVGATPAVEVTLPTGLPGVTYVVSNLTTGEDIPVTPSTAGGVSYLLPIGADVSITAIPARGYAIIRKNPLVIESVDAATAQGIIDDELPTAKPDKTFVYDFTAKVKTTGSKKVNGGKVTNYTVNLGKNKKGEFWYTAPCIWDGSKDKHVDITTLTGKTSRKFAVRGASGTVYKQVLSVTYKSKTSPKLKNPPELLVAGLGDEAKADIAAAFGFDGKKTSYAEKSAGVYCQTFGYADETPSVCYRVAETRTITGTYVLWGSSADGALFVEEDGVLPDLSATMLFRFGALTLEKSKNVELVGEIGSDETVPYFCLAGQGELKTLKDAKKRTVEGISTLNGNIVGRIGAPTCETCCTDMDSIAWDCDGSLIDGSEEEKSVTAAFGTFSLKFNSKKSSFAAPVK